MRTVTVKIKETKKGVTIRFTTKEGGTEESYKLDRTFRTVTDGLEVLAAAFLEIDGEAVEE